MTSVRDRGNRRLWEAGWWAPHPATGPDEVHRILIAKDVVHHYEIGESWDFEN